MTRRWHRRDDVLWRRTLEGIVVARPERDGPDPVTIGGGGVAVWECLDRPRSTAELVDALVATFTADRDTVERDVEVLLTDLERHGYVTRTRL